MYFESETLPAVLPPRTLKIILTSSNNASKSLPDVQTDLPLINVLLSHISSHDVWDPIVDVTFVDEVFMVYFSDAVRIALEPLANIHPIFRRIVALTR